MAITNQLNLKSGLRLGHEPDYPSSAGRVSDKGMHIPDLDMIDANNVLPTAEGYCSFFGKDKTIDAIALPTDKVQEIMTYRTEHGDTVQLAFTALGLYIRSISGSATATVSTVSGTPDKIVVDMPDGSADWIFVFSATYGHASAWHLWTYAIIENDLYIYHKGLKYIYRMYSVEKFQVLFDQLTPSYIISQDKLWRFTITAEDDSDGDDTEKAVEFNTDSGLYLGTYTHSVDKAHQVWNAEKVVLAPFHTGVSAIMTNLVRNKVDIDATFELDTYYVNPSIYANGEASEMIATWDTWQVSGVNRDGHHAALILDDIELDGTLTITIGSTPDASVDVILTGSDTKATVIERIIQAVETINLDPDVAGDNYHVVHIEDKAIYKDEISLEFYVSTEVTFFIDLGVSYTGTGTVSVQESEGSLDYYAYATKIKPLYHIDTLSNYSIFAEGEQVTITVDDIDYTVTATDGESSSSIMSRLRDLILAESNFIEVVLDTPDGSFTFTKTDPETWDLGGMRTSPITVSNNLQLVSTKWESTTKYDPNWQESDYSALRSSLRIQGFKEYGLTTVGLDLDGDYHTVPMSSIYDSNDLVDELSSLFNSIGVSHTLTIDDEASATADYTLQVTIPIFDNSTPSPTMTQDGTTLWSITDTDSEIIDLLQVDGIFEARGRIGYWTYDNTLGWSAHNNPTDFTPSTVTKANQISVKSIKGDIVLCKGYENGFVVLASGNVMQARYDPNSQNVFIFSGIEKAPGLIDPRHFAKDLGMMYYWHPTGFYVLDPASKQLQEQLAKDSDWINSHQYPVSLQVLANRFVVFNLLSDLSTVSNRRVRKGGTTIAGYLEAAMDSPFWLSIQDQGRNLYPTYKRALILDTKLSRWATCDQEYLVLASLAPYNQSGYQLDKDYKHSTRFLDNEQRGILIFSTDSKVWIANDNPPDAYMTFGHYATHRLRRTKLIEVVSEYAVWPDVIVDIEPSLDKTLIEWQYKQSKDITEPNSRVYPNMSAYWFDITFKGRFHMKRGLIKGHTHGR